MSEGARRRPRLGFAIPLPVGLSADAERLDILLTERRTAAEVRARVSSAAPKDHTLIDVHDVWIGAPPLAGQVIAADYRLSLASGLPVDALRAAVETLLRLDRIERVRRRGERSTPYDLRPFLIALSVHDDPGGGGGPRLWMRLRAHPELGIGRPDEVVAALGETVGAPIEVVDAVRERLWTADELPETSPPGSEPTRAGPPD